MTSNLWRFGVLRDRSYKHEMLISSNKEVCVDDQRNGRNANQWTSEETKTFGDTGRSAACTPHHEPVFNFCTGDTLKHSLPLHEWKPLLRLKGQLLLCLMYHTIQRWSHDRIGICLHVLYARWMVNLSIHLGKYVNINNLVK